MISAALLIFLFVIPNVLAADTASQNSIAGIFIYIGLALFALVFILTVVLDIRIFDEASRIHKKKNGRALRYFNPVDRINLSFVGFKVLLGKPYLEENFSVGLTIFYRIYLALLAIMIACFVIGSAYLQ